MIQIKLKFEVSITYFLNVYFKLIKRSKSIRKKYHCTLKIFGKNLRFDEKISIIIDFIRKFDDYDSYDYNSFHLNRKLMIFSIFDHH